MMVCRLKQVFFTVLATVSVVLFIVTISSTNSPGQGNRVKQTKVLETRQMIIIITPTYPRPTRFADITRMATALSQVPDIYWIVLEDRPVISSVVEKIIRRHVKNFFYFPCPTKKGYPAKGWFQRTTALDVIRRKRKSILGAHTKGVIYFGDDDNAYDIRLFNDYIRNVEKIGVWAVSLVGGTPIESQQINNQNKVEKYRVAWRAERPFAIDMAGFAIDMDTVLSVNAVFPTSCKIGFGAPEPCFINQFNITKEDLEPFGYGPEDEREILVWHTKAVQPRFKAKDIDLNGYQFEFLPDAKTTTHKPKTTQSGSN